MTISTEIPTAEPVPTDVPSATLRVLTEMDRAIISALLELCFGIPQTRTESIAIYPTATDEQAKAQPSQPEPAKSRTESHRMPIAQPQAT